MQAAPAPAARLPRGRQLADGRAELWGSSRRDHSSCLTPSWRSKPLAVRASTCHARLPTLCVLLATRLMQLRAILGAAANAVGRHDMVALHKGKAHGTISVLATETTPETGRNAQAARGGHGQHARTEPRPRICSGTGARMNSRPTARGSSCRAGPGQLPIPAAAAGCRPGGPGCPCAPATRTGGTPLRATRVGPPAAGPLRGSSRVPDSIKPGRGRAAVDATPTAALLPRRLQLGRHPARRRPSRQTPLCSATMMKRPLGWWTAADTGSSAPALRHRRSAFTQSFHNVGRAKIGKGADGSVFAPAHIAGTAGLPAPHQQALSTRWERASAAGSRRTGPFSGSCARQSRRRRNRSCPLKQAALRRARRQADRVSFLVHSVIPT